MWFFNNRLLGGISTITKPLNGGFSLNVDTNNFIDASIYFSGDYESYLKTHYKQLIKPGDYVIDVGANIGFHSMYFAELAGQDGKVFAFEPIQQNYRALISNLDLNHFKQVIPEQIALANENKEIEIHIDPTITNPGAYNLLSKGIKNTRIICKKGDEFLKDRGIDKINFIKIDVEGYEHEVLKGLKNTIVRERPVIIFEYDRNYQLKMNSSAAEIFEFFKDLNYEFNKIDGYGNKTPFFYNDQIQGAEILALPL